MSEYNTLRITDVLVKSTTNPAKKVELTFKLSSASNKTKLVKHEATANGKKEIVLHYPLVFSEHLATIEIVAAPSNIVQKDTKIYNFQHNKRGTPPWTAGETVDTKSIDTKVSASKQYTYTYTKVYITGPGGGTFVDIIIWVMVVAVDLNSEAYLTKPIYVAPESYFLPLGKLDFFKSDGTREKPFSFVEQWSKVHTLALAIKYRRSIIFLSGTYKLASDTDIVTGILIDYGGSPNHPWVFKSDVKHGAKFLGNNYISTAEQFKAVCPNEKQKSPAALPGRQYGIRIRGNKYGIAKHIVVDGFWFEGVTQGIYINENKGGGNSDIVIINVKISNVLQETALNFGDIPGYSGSYFQGILTGAWAHKILIENCEFIDMGLPDTIDLSRWTTTVSTINNNARLYGLEILAKFYSASVAEVFQSHRFSKFANSMPFYPDSGFEWPCIPNTLRRMSLANVGIPFGLIFPGVRMAFYNWIVDDVLESQAMKVMLLLDFLAGGSLLAAIQYIADELKPQQPNKPGSVGVEVVQYIVATRASFLEDQHWISSYLKSHALYLGGYDITIRKCYFRGINRGRAIKILGWMETNNMSSLPSNWPKTQPTVTIEQCVFVGDGNPSKWAKEVIWLVGPTQNLHILNNVAYSPQGGRLITVGKAEYLSNSPNIKIQGNTLYCLEPREMELLVVQNALMFNTKNIKYLFLNLTFSQKQQLNSNSTIINLSDDKYMSAKLVSKLYSHYILIDGQNYISYFSDEVITALVTRVTDILDPKTDAQSKLIEYLVRHALYSNRTGVNHSTNVWYLLPVDIGSKAILEEFKWFTGNIARSIIPGEEHGKYKTLP